MTASDQLARHARTVPDAAALRFAGTGRTYRELDLRVSRLAEALRRRGVRAGDRIAVLGLNSAEVVECYLASVRLGAIGVPLNFRLTAAEISYQLGDSGAVAMLVDAALAPMVAAAREQRDAVRTCLVIGGTGGTGTVGEDYETALADAETSQSGPAAEPVDEQAPAFIMYTSGTTGRPKGAVLTHRNLLLHAFSSGLHLGTAAEDRVSLCGAPLFHIAGLSGYLLTLLPGGTFVITPSGAFDPEASVRLMASERVTNCFFVPSQWQAICQAIRTGPELRELDLSALRRILWGASPASTALLRTMMETFPGAEVLTAFGQTECSPVTCYLRGEDSLRKIGSVGTPMLNVEVRVVDEQMNDVPPGQVGEIVYRGPMVMKEYWNDPEATAEAFAGGWFHSGDLVRQDEDGYFYVVDRKKDVIISGGENIYCAEVEDVLAQHSQVVAVAVIGVPHPRWGESPLAVVVPADADDPPTAEELERYARARLAGYKCPRQVAIVAALPRNAAGKVLKTELRTTFVAGGHPALSPV